MKPKRATAADIDELAARAFPRALARYSPYLLVGRPVVVDDELVPFARIDLGSRGIKLGARAIAEHGLEASLEALIAHEIGHHVAFPGSPTQAARLLLLERTFLPNLPRSLTTPFYDLLIDERLAAESRPGSPADPIENDLCRILGARAKIAPKDLVFAFQRAVMEELWQRPEGDLVGEAIDDLEQKFPDFRIDARLVAQNLFVLAPDITLQYLYFASVAFRYAYASDPAESDEGEAGCFDDELSAETWAEALVAKNAERDAIKRAIKEGWFDGDTSKRLSDQSLEQRAAGVPGQGDRHATFVTETMAAHYRREAERYLFHPPPVRMWAEALVPTTLEEWEPGDPVAGIDWVATLLARGETLGAAVPLMRERIADEEGQSEPTWRGKTEIYLDVSGSMPDPTRALNAMTLAAQILVMGTLRAGGAARALVYSTEYEKAFAYCRSEKILSRFLMRYIGGGTSFPFEVLAASVEEQRHEQPIRVVITDADFDANYDAKPENQGIFRRAAERSPALVLLLHAPRKENIRRYEQAGARVVAVRTLDDFPRMAASLAFSLFEPSSHAALADEDIHATTQDKNNNKNVVPQKLVR